MAMKGKVLLVDDDSARAQLLAASIVAGGFTVERTNEGIDCSAPLSISADIDVVVCTFLLSGLSTAITLSMSDHSLLVPVILFGDDVDSDSVVAALRVGAKDFFNQVLDHQPQLVAAIGHCVGEAQMQRDLAAARQNLERANTELRGTIKVLQQDQQAGRQVQMRMLPATPLLLDDYAFSHTVIPSLYLSGDFTDYFTVGDNFVTFLMADVSGHGSSSAFATVLLKNLFARKRSDFLRKQDDAILSPIAMLERANTELLDLAVGKFATMVVGVMDVANNTLRYSVAGHLPQPVIVCDEGARYLRGEGSAVGLMEQAQFEEHYIKLPQRFMLALFSDGILEILPPKNLIDKERYFLDVFHAMSDTPEQVVTQLGLDHVETAPDDIAALFINKRA